jgi:hypothetical protein
MLISAHYFTDAEWGISWSINSMLNCYENITEFGAGPISDTANNHFFWKFADELKTATKMGTLKQYIVDHSSAATFLGLIREAGGDNSTPWLFRILRERFIGFDYCILVLLRFRNSL